MRFALKVFAAEALKAHRRLFGSPTVVFSMFLWPLLQLAGTYYTVRPVTTTPGIAERWPLAADPHQLLAFLATGALAYTFFSSLVQSAWQFALERSTGTLETLFLTPVNRLVMVVANGAGALIQNAWLFGCFVVALGTVLDVVDVANPAMYGVVFLALLLPAVAWGAFVNSLLIFTRDPTLLFTVIEEPLWFVSGVRLPLFALPVWIKAIGTMVPLTGSIIITRDALLERAGLVDVLPQLGWVLLLSAALLAAAALVLRVGEARSQRTGQLGLF